MTSPKPTFELMPSPHYSGDSERVRRFPYEALIFPEEPQNQEKQVMASRLVPPVGLAAIRSPDNIFEDTREPTVSPPAPRNINTHPSFPLEVPIALSPLPPQDLHMEAPVLSPQTPAVWSAMADSRVAQGTQTVQSVFI
eukprot:CAMPEP_0184308574 /NCGR_PEP_ID=MMETSP1049-20130417/16991_1 /TAXON_ID=77928 /ORGANISM="Proteomonas sulcata, Strain CCMP704" /LENGTH=138 /DNA_ID=CAMNT_0026621287 /DNA_START=149 /DNA_END=565 /DNA_ORIENTATION=-